MLKNYGVEAADSYKNGKVLLKQPRIIIATMGMFQLDKTVHLRSAFKSKGFQIKQTEWDTYFNQHAEASKSFQISKIDSVKYLLQKTNKN